MRNARPTTRAQTFDFGWPGTGRQLGRGLPHDSFKCGKDCRRFDALESMASPLELLRVKTPPRSVFQRNWRTESGALGTADNQLGSAAVCRAHPEACGIDNEVAVQVVPGFVGRFSNQPDSVADQCITPQVHLPGFDLARSGASGAPSHFLGKVNANPSAQFVRRFGSSRGLPCLRLRLRRSRSRV